MTKVCPFSKRSLKYWLAAFRKFGFEGPGKQISKELKLILAKHQSELKLKNELLNCVKKRNNAR